MSATADTTRGESGREFPSTIWSSVLSLRDPGDPSFGATLNALIDRYWKPVYHYVRALRRVDVEEAKDLTQQFFARLLERRDLERLSPERGTLRGFLKTALKNFLVSADRTRAAHGPRDGARVFAFDEAERDWTETARAAPGVTPEEAFDREWACEVVMEAVRRLKAKLEADGKAAYFDLFRDYCLEPSGLRLRADSADGAPESPSLADLAARYKQSPKDVENHLAYARQTISKILRALLADTLGPGEDVERELKFLLSR